jgi:hypothetical protein
MMLARIQKRPHGDFLRPTSKCGPGPELEELHWLQNAWREGIDSGDAGEINFGDLKQEARRRLAAKS